MVAWTILLQEPCLHFSVRVRVCVCVCVICQCYLFYYVEVVIQSVFCIRDFRSAVCCGFCVDILALKYYQSQSERISIGCAPAKIKILIEFGKWLRIVKRRIVNRFRPLVL
jgi:hypothetical protein